MCGIAGIYGLEGLNDPGSLVRRMTDAMAHRGPDADGVYVGGNVALGHRRLSIIDLSHSADQPFRSPDGRHTIIFNGEIYNYRALRSELEGMGHWTFRTSSDTEVLLAAYLIWGAACLDRLEGMFAFAVLNEAEQELFIARDRLGIKPLYYHQSGGHVVFASEVRSLLATGLVPRLVDPDGLVDHLRYQTVHAPATLVKDVYMLRPGHWMRISDQEVAIQQWWGLSSNVQMETGDLPLEEVHKGIRERLRRAVEKRLISDVPFGAFLSGGIDSSAIVGLMAEVSNAPVHTFSVVFDEEEFSEERFAAIVAKRFRTEHTTLRLRGKDLLDSLGDVLSSMDHPSGDGVNTWMVSRATKQAGITVALSGLGSDEIFAGYPVFTRSKDLFDRRWLAQFPRWMRRYALAALVRIKPSFARSNWPQVLLMESMSADDTYPLSRLLANDQVLQGLLSRPRFPKNSVREAMHRMIRSEQGHRLPFFSQVSLGELDTYLANVLLRDTDQMSMAHALEVRVPFLDHDLVEFVLGVNDRFKYPHTPKQLLTAALGDLLPREIIDRPKMGFVLPWPQWMRSELRTFCGERMHRLGQRQAFKPGAVDAFWNAFIQKDPRANWFRIWSMVVLEDWMERHGMDIAE
ncbi:MAG: asparagine synthase (glutamine-hydrolyzing) [Flavobacteriales bacterium]|nr:asparagine synthase (glutamine-hydrolyzing) [Flavobacteriales bacterium]